jgi:Na+/H+-translocating membrane pyrophosphatase
MTTISAVMTRPATAHRNRLSEVKLSPPAVVKRGHGTNVIQGLAISLESTALPAIVIVAGIIVTYGLTTISAVMTRPATAHRNRLSEVKLSPPAVVKRVEIAHASVTGHGTNVIQGLAISLESTALPAIVIVAGSRHLGDAAGIVGDRAEGVEGDDDAGERQHGGDRDPTPRSPATAPT